MATTQIYLLSLEFCRSKLLLVRLVSTGLLDFGSTGLLDFGSTPLLAFGSTGLLVWPSLWRVEESRELDMEDHFLLGVLVRGEAAERCVGVVGRLLGVMWALSKGLL